jgi:hypothetical protein
MSTSLVLKISRNPKAGRGLRVGKLAFRLGDSPDRQFRKISPTLYPSPLEASERGTVLKCQLRLMLFSLAVSNIFPIGGRQEIGAHALDVGDTRLRGNDVQLEHLLHRLRSSSPLCNSPNH